MVNLLKNASSHNLKELDLQNNFIDYRTCLELSSLAKEQGIRITLLGNRVLDEVLKAVTHGIGEVLVVFGSIFLGLLVSDKPQHYKVCIAIYCTSLNVLYLSS